MVCGFSGFSTEGSKSRPQNAAGMFSRERLPERLSERMLIKPDVSCSLGVRFIDPAIDPTLWQADGRILTVVEHLVEGSIAAEHLRVGEIVTSVNGKICQTPREASWEAPPRE